MKNLISIVLGTILVPTIAVFGQTSSVRNYKMPVQNRKVVKTQDIAINKSNVAVSNSFESPQNYKRQVFSKNQVPKDLLVLRFNAGNKAEDGINPLESNRNYKSPVISKSFQRDTSNVQLATLK